MGSVRFEVTKKQPTLFNADENEMKKILAEINIDPEHDDVDFGFVDLVKYNGEITAYNPKTGQHRTFKISTVKKGGLKGQRLLSLLIGNDNETSYKAFARVFDDGTISVWQKYRRANIKGRELTVYERFADMLQRSAYFAEKHDIEFKHSVRCRKCNKKLTDPVSINLGIGPVCRGEM